MTNRRAPMQHPRRAGRAAGAPPASRTPPVQAQGTRVTGARLAWMSDPRTWTGRIWRQVISQTLFVVLALSGLGLVAVSAKNLEQAVVWGLLVMSVVAALWIGRAKR